MVPAVRRRSNNSARIALIDAIWHADIENLRSLCHELPRCARGKQMSALEVAACRTFYDQQWSQRDFLELLWLIEDAGYGPIPEGVLQVWLEARKNALPVELWERTRFQQPFQAALVATLAHKYYLLARWHTMRLV